MGKTLDEIRKALIFNQAEAVRFITERDDLIREMQKQMDLLEHRCKCLLAEVHARGAAAAALRQELKEITERGGGVVREPRRDDGRPCDTEASDYNGA